MTTESQDAEAEGRHGERTFTIIVNGRPVQETRRELTFEDVVRLAYPTPPTGDNIEYTVTYRRGVVEKPEGTLLPGGTVKLKHEMIFNVTATDKS